MEKLIIKPSGNKSRFGYRGPKKRYSTFKAEWNQKWLPVEEELTKRLCEQHGLNPEDFIDLEDNSNRKWFYALDRVEKLVKKMPL